MRNVGRYDDSAKPGTPRYQKAVKEFAQALRLLRYRVKPHAYRRIASRWFRFHAARELYLKSWFFRCPEAHPTLMDRLQALVRRHDKESVRHGATLLAAILRERSSHAAHNPTHITRADITRARRLGISSPIDLANLRRARLRAATVARSPRQRRNWMRDTPGAPPPPGGVGRGGRGGVGGGAWGERVRRGDARSPRAPPPPPGVAAGVGAGLRHRRRLRSVGCAGCVRRRGV